MNTAEAKLFFPFDDQDDLSDLWEERFFKHKQFFLNRPPIKKVFLSRLAKIEKQWKAYLYLSGYERKKGETIKMDTSINSEYVREAFDALHQKRNRMKGVLLSASDFESLQEILHQWFLLEKNYQKKWFYEAESDSSAVVLAKEPDPMKILKSLKEWQGDQTEEKSFSDLKKEYAFLPNVLQNEVKRLTLLYKKQDE